MRFLVLTSLFLDFLINPVWGFLSLPSKLGTRRGRVRAAVHQSTVAKAHRSNDSTDDKDTELTAREREKLDDTRRWTIGSLGGLAASMAAPKKAQATGATTATAAADTNLESGSVVYDGIINKSPSDPRSYRSLTLSNGVEVLVVTDPNVDSAAAALNVHVGHYSDPPVMPLLSQEFSVVIEDGHRRRATPGLAHFCEHMLFLGTKSFPQEGAFESYLSSHGGRSNAFTGAEDTCYFFEVQLPNPRASGTSARSQAQAKGVDYATSVVTGEAVKQKAAAIAQDILLGPEGALQRFSGFFYEPLFTPSGASREINAVDSENGKNLQQDSWRLGQLQKHTRADPRHPNFNFGTGTKETLSGDGAALRKQLVDFWEQNYLAPLMTLVVVSSLDANVVQGAVEKAFAPIPSTRDGTPTDSNKKGKEEAGQSRQSFNQRPLLPPESVWRAQNIPAFADPNAPGAPTPFVVLAKPVAPLRVLRLVWPLARPDPYLDLYSSGATTSTEGGAASSTAATSDSADAVATARAANAADLLAKPTLVISNLLGHEGPSSLLQYLRAQGLANALSSGASYDSTDSSTLEVEISLTGRGLEQWEEVASLTFGYLALLRSPKGGVPPHFMDECAKLADISWRFQERAPPMAYAESLATSLPELRASRGPPGVLGPARYLDGRRLFLDPTSTTSTSTASTGSSGSSSGGGSSSGSGGKKVDQTSSYKLVPPSVLAPLVKDVLAKLTPRAALLTLIAPEFTTTTTNAANDNAQHPPSLESGSSTKKRTFPVLNQHEPWYGTSYGTVPIEDLLSKCQDDAQALKLLPSTIGLPKPNRFVPTQFAFKAALITDDGGSSSDLGSGLSPTSTDGATAAAAKIPAHAVAFRQLSSLQSRRTMFSSSSSSTSTSVSSNNPSVLPTYSPSSSAFEAELTRPPELILDDAKWRGWFKQDATFGGPRAILSVSIANPLASPTVETTVASKLWRACFVDRLAAEVYDATLAGLSYDVDVTVRGLRLTVIGPDQTLPDFALKVAKAARAFDPTSPPPGGGNNAQAALETFERQRELLIRDVESMLVQQPIQTSKYWESNLLERPFYPLKAYQAALASSTLSSVAEHAKHLWQQPCNAQALLQGNVKRNEADKLFSGLQGALTWQGGALPWSQRPTKRLALVPRVPQALALLKAGQGEGNGNDVTPSTSSTTSDNAAAAAAVGVYPTITRAGFDPSNANSAVTLTWQIPATSPAFTEENSNNAALSTAPSIGSIVGIEPQLSPNEILLATAQVWAAAVNEPFFKVLRTEQQLGYLVNSGLRNNDGVATFVLVVQSSKYGVDLIQMRMASFMASAEKEVLEKLSASDVVALAKSESDKRKMRDKRLIQQVSRHFTELETGTKQWDRADREATALLQVDKAKLVAFYQRYLAPNSPERRALAVHVTSPSSSSAVATAADSKLTAYIKDVADFKKALPNIPLRDPEITL